MATVTVTQITDTLQQQLNISAQSGKDKRSTTTDNQKQPDIEYHPDRAKWKARTARRLETDPSLPDTALPEGFPQKLDSPLVWEGKDWKDEREWVYQLKAAEIQEIGDAVKYFHGEYDRVFSVI